MGAFVRPDVYGDLSELSPMTFDRKQLVPLLKELIGRQPVSDEYATALAWLIQNVPVFVARRFGLEGNGPQCRRYDMALRRASEGIELCFYDRQLLEEIAEQLHDVYGETLWAHDVA